MLSIRQILPYLQTDSKADLALKGWLCPYYEEAKAVREEFDTVFGNEYPAYLDVNRPKEQPEHKQYRRTIYKNPFISLLNDLEDSLDYIQEADDYSIVWPQTKESQELEALMHPKGNETWEEFFHATVKEAYRSDPNAVLVVIPRQQPNSELERYLPGVEVIPSAHVLRYERERLAVLESLRTNRIDVDGRQQRVGRILYFLDRDSFSVAEETSRTRGRSQWRIWGLRTEVDGQGQSRGVFQPLRHYCRSLPARKIGQKRRKWDGNGSELYKSLFDHVYAQIKDAQARYNDIQIEIVHHVHSQEWRYAMNPCPNKECKDGKVPVRDGGGTIVDSAECKRCSGTGYDLTNSGLGVLIYSMAKRMGHFDPGGPGLPPVPGGFIPRPIESLRELVREYERLEREIYRGMKMLFTLQTPEIQSGVAKAKDREEMYRVLVKYGAYLCGLQEWMYVMGAHYVFGERGAAFAPSVINPIRFDLSNSEETRQELNDARTHNYDPTLIAVLEGKVLEDNVSKDTDLYKRYQLRRKLDPYPMMNFEQKAYMFAFLPNIAQRGSESYERLVREYTFSMNFDRNVNRAIEENEDFLNLPLAQQRTILTRINEEVLQHIPTEFVDQIVAAPPVNIRETNQLG